MKRRDLFRLAPVIPAVAVMAITGEVTHAEESQVTLQISPDALHGMMETVRQTSMHKGYMLGQINERERAEQEREVIAYGLIPDPDMLKACPALFFNNGHPRIWEIQSNTVQVFPGKLVPLYD